MNSTRRKKVEELKNSRLYKFSHKWSIAFLILTIAFITMMITSGLIIARYLILSGIIIALITLMVFPAMYSWRFKRNRRIICLGLSFLLSIAYGIGIFYFIGTLDFFSKITQAGVTTEEYYVIVRDDGLYKRLRHIKGEKVYTYASGSGFDDAVEELEDDVDVTISKKDDLKKLVDDLLNGKKNVLFLNAANHESICESHKTFGDDTKVLKTIKVKCQAVDVAKRVKVDKEAFNVYITGIDKDGDITTLSRSDVNMIATVNPKTKKILLTSFPRDYYVKVEGLAGQSDKLTHTGLYGAIMTTNTVSDLMDMDMNYYVKVNFSTVKELINAIGGVTVHSDFDFKGLAPDASWYYYKKGDNFLNGDQALVFARERNSFSDGDFQRNKNQQAVLTAVLTKVTSSKTLLTKYASILNSVELYIEMNFTPKEIKSIVKMQMKDMSRWEIQTQSVTGEISENLMPCYSLGGAKASVVIPDEDSIDAAKEKIKKVMEER